MMMSDQQQKQDNELRSGSSSKSKECFDRASTKAGTTGGTGNRIPNSNITEHDVLSGRGGATNHHPGNVRFRYLVKKFQGDYIRATRKEKPTIAMSIVNEVRNNGGRFVKQVDGASNIHSETMWMELGDKKAREKTSQALREGAPEAKNLLDFSNSFIVGDIGTIPIIQPPAAAPLSSTELQHPLNNVNVVRNNGGRFVKQIDGTSTIHSETMWVELGDKEAREKTGQGVS